MLRNLLSRIFRQATERWSGDAAQMETLGKGLFRERKFAEAADAFRRAAKIEPRNAGMWNKLGFALFECGQAGEALQAYRRALALEPGSALVIQNFLFATNFTRATQADSLALHREWAARLAPPGAASVAPHLNTRDPERRLRIGYLSADLRGHTVAYYLAPILAQHDRERHAVHCYSNTRASDAMTSRLRGNVDGWREVAGMTDTELARTIRADGIDILVDLSGHTAGNRAGAVALQPAPLQVAYLGYPSTLGMPAVGYRFTDRVADAPGESQSRYVEKLLYLPDCAWCFDPLRPPPDTTATPEHGTAILFGSLNSVTKLSPETIALWAEILRTAPSSRLHLARVPAGRLREDLAAAFAQLGVAAERIEFSGIVPLEEFGRQTRRIDVALDPFPCNGGATTCETLWNGTPLVALIGDTFASRASYSVLANSGLAELAAATPQAYVRLAVAFANDPQRCRKLRATVAERFRASPIMDAPGFTRGYEAVLREAWRQWCMHGGASSADVQGPARTQAAGAAEDPEYGAFRNAIDAGAALHDAGDYAGALVRFEDALALRPEAAEPHYRIGLACMRQGRSEDAVDALAMALHYAPEMAAAHHEMAIAEHKLGRVDAALASVERAIVLGAGTADAHNLRGALLMQREDVDGAVASFERAVQIDPRHSLAHGNLGYVLFRDREDYERGARHIQTALELNPANLGAQCNHTMVLAHKGDLEGALALCNRLLSATPDLHEARLNRALTLLKMGRFETAWDDYEARKLVRSNYVPRALPHAEWQGGDLAGKTILVHGEQGLGDEIMFASCFAELIAAAGHCVIECSPRLERLLARSFPAATVVAAGGTGLHEVAGARRIDLQVAAGSLPRLWRRSRSSFPEHRGYLAADPGAIGAWRTRLAALGDGLKVGLSWRGGMQSTRRSLRSLDLAELEPLFGVRGCSLVDLQYGDTGAERVAFEQRSGHQMHRWQESIDDFDQGAALLSCLDVVITVCTAVVHLSGALGRPAWVLVPATPEWRYLADGERMPWYPSVRLFRQQQGQTWAPVVDALADALRTRATGRST